MLVRHQLLDRINTDFLPQIILIIAPTGYGKTVFAQQIAECLDLATIWLHLYERHQDISVLHQSVGELLMQIEPSVQLPPSHDWYDSAKSIARSFNLIDRPSLLVLDDVHHAEGISSVEQWLDLLIETLPENGHIMLVGQAVPAVSWPKIVVGGKVLVFNANELCFTVDEVRQLSGLSQEDAQIVTDRCAGWPAGIELACHAELATLAQLSARDDPNNTTIFDTLARHVFDQQLPDIRRALLVTSVVAIFSNSICHAMGLHDLESYVVHIQRQGLFLDSFPGGYRYHQLFREFLQQYLIQTDYDLYLSLHQKAGQWYEDRDVADEAIEHYVAGQAMHDAKRLAESIAQEFYMFGRWQSLLRFEQLLSGEVPRLSMFCAMVYIEWGQYDRAQEHLQLARKGYTQVGDNAALIRVELQIAHLNTRIRQYTKAIEMLDRICQHPLSSASEAWSEQIYGRACMGLGRYEDAVIHLRRALGHFDAEGLDHSRTHVLHNLNLAFENLGQLEEAGEVLQIVVALARETGNLIELAFALNDLGYHYHLLSLYKDAQEIYNEGLSLVRGNARVAGYLHLNYGNLLRDLGEYSKAEQHYNNALTIAKYIDSRLYVKVVTSFAKLRLWQRRFDDAKAWLDILGDTLDDLMYLIPVMRVIAALLTSSSEGSVVRAMSLMRDLVANSTPLRVSEIVGVYWFLATIKGNDSLLQHGLQLINKLNMHLYQPLAADIVNMQMLDHVSRYRQQLPDLFDVIAKLTNMHNDTAQYTITIVTPAQIRIQDFGLSSVVFNDSEVRNWTVMIAKELFLYLATKGPQRKENVLLVFWPDHDPQVAHRNFHDTLKRIRRAIPNGVVHDNELYQVHHNLQVERDSVKYEDYVQRARRLPPKNVRTEDLYRRALELYRGDFLSDIYSEWTESYRRHFSELFLVALVGVGSCVQARGDHITAITYFERALERDKFSEGIYRAMMESYAQLGHKQLIQEAYQRYQHLIQIELGLTPSSGFREFTNNLLSN